MKLNRTSLAIAGLGALLLGACGGKSSSSPAPVTAMSITTDNGAGTTTRVDATSANSTYSAYQNATQGQTIVQVCADVDADQDCSHIVILTLDGTTAKTYSVTAPDAVSQINYHDDETETGVVSHYQSSDGQVVVTEVGASVKGTFAATMACNNGCAGNVTISGSFDVPLSQ